MRRLRLVLVCAAFVFAPSSAAAVRIVDSGIVVRIQPPVFAIRELDGTRRRFTVNRATVVTLNGQRVRLARIRRGDVANVEHRGRFVVEVKVTRP